MAWRVAWSEKMKHLIFMLLLLSVLLLAGCTSKQQFSNGERGVFEKIYASDPQRTHVGKELQSGYSFVDIEGNSVSIESLKGKPLVIETFFVSCPSCAQTIKNFRELYDKYDGRINIIYFDVNPADTDQNIAELKKKYNGGNWIWVKYDENVASFLQNNGVKGADITYIVDKKGIVRDAYSIIPPVERLDRSISELI